MGLGSYDARSTSDFSNDSLKRVFVFNLAPMIARIRKDGQRIMTAARSGFRRTGELHRFEFADHLCDLR
jgi:hypothetical protein